MKQKLFTLLFILAASVGNLLAHDAEIDGIYYNLDSSTKTATVTYRGDSFDSYNNEYSGNVVIPSSVTYDGKTYSVTSIGEFAFYGCSGLTSVIIGKAVTSIGSEAFNSCTGLISIGISNSVISIGWGAFRNCSGLTSIDIPSSVTNIAKHAFSGCTSLVSITIPSSVTNLDYIIGYNETTSQDFSFFKPNYNLKEVNAPASFFNVQEEYWSKTPKSLEKVVINCGELNDNALGVIARSYKTLTSLDISTVSNTTLADEAFKDFYNMKDIALPANLTSISYMAVAGCVHLKEIDIPASVEEIDDRAFEDCRSIETITFGGKQPSSMQGKHFMPAAESKLKRIGNWAFYNAHELQHLEIPEGVEEIGDAAFYGCTYLEDLVLPSTVQSIGDNCFALCSKLQQITITSLVPPIIRARTFYDVSRAIPVYVLDEVVEDYLDAPYWNEMNIMGGATAINNVSTDNQLVSSTKILRDGQIYILRNDKTYTLTGAEVK